MRKLALLLVVCLAVAPAVVAAGTSTNLEVQRAIDSSSDAGSVTYTFTAQASGNTTTISITSATSQSAAGGDVTLEYQGWEAVGASGSGSGTSWTARDGVRYRVRYRVRARNGASEQRYRFDFSAQDSDGTTYSSPLYANVDVLEPQFGTPNSVSTDLTFGQGSSAATTVEASFDNVGDGVMVPTSTSVSGVPSGMSVTPDDPPSRVSAGGSGSLSVDVRADESVSEGTHRFTVTVEDNLGNSVDVPVSVDVHKPPIAEVNGGSPVNLGGIIRGTSETTSVSVAEVSGRGAIDSLEVGTDSEGYATLDLSALRGTYVSAGSSVNRDVTVSVSGDAPQGKTFRWSVPVSPSDADSPSRTVVFKAKVLYRAYYDGVTAESTRLVYDEPKSSTTEFTTEVSVDVHNGGDLPMQFTDVSATTGSSAVDAEVTYVPDSIEGKSTGEIRVQLSGDPDAAEREYAYTVSLQAEDAGGTQVSNTVEVVHKAAVGTEPSDLTFSEIPVSEERTRSATLRERLGYEDVQNLRIRKTAGPDQWIEVIEKPSSLSAGESGTFLVGVTFDANATLYKEYTWTYEVTGDNVPTRQVTVQAVPRPVQCSKVVQWLGDYDGSQRSTRIASSMADAIRQLEDRLRENPQGATADLSRACTAGQSAKLFLQANRNATERIDAGNRSAAQTYVGRMAVSYNTLSASVDRIETDDVRDTASTAATLSGDVLDERIASQVGYYNRTLSEDATVLRKAGVYRELSQLAALQGDKRRAAAFESRASDSFTRYASLVSKGNKNLQGARSLRDSLDRSLFVNAFGVRAFWIGSLDRFQRQRSTVLDRYRTAQESFATAGATERAATARSERAAIADSYRTARLVSLVLGGVFGLLFLVVVGIEARGVYRYVQDANEAVTGEFLL